MTEFRDFPFPLNVLLTVLEREEGSANVVAMHYGLFEAPGDSIAAAQERSTALLLSRLPPPPARLLEVGIGLGTTLARLAAMGYAAEGLTPDPVQAAAARKRFGESIGVHVAPLEMFETESRYDAVFFQESSQYIDAEALFARAKTLTKNVIVLDEFALRPIDEPGALHSRDAFLAAAARHGFAVIEELDLSAKAAPTMAYFTDRIPQYRQRLMRDLGLTDADIDHLVENGVRYRERYANGTYGYRLIRLRRG